MLKDLLVMAKAMENRWLAVRAVPFLSHEYAMWANQHRLAWSNQLKQKVTSTLLKQGATPVGMCLKLVLQALVIEASISSSLLSSEAKIIHDQANQGEYRE